ncbi:Afadin and alpha-actinin-binding-domain-containing protein [Biscogniauxia mediterranea]|nr:Afadin and alpha-actinin-binding-domain-containing protein [Biscogniauxia mediterranea]
MIDAENLRTASLYINNQLLSRGLLRDGQSIDFADPEMGDGGLQATMGRVMSVVNDLILRRDRDAEHREALSTTLRGLRAESQRQTTELTRQSDKLQDTQRRLDGAEATERALRAQLKTAESHIHKLKEEMVRLKGLVAQTRAACANEVRKRDRQIDSLKKAVTDAGRVRGGGKSRDIMTISIVGEVGAGMGEDGGAGMGLPAGATEAEGYSLRMETNEFLTELARGLSEENEGLLALVRRTVEGLREMSGLDRNGESVNGYDSQNGNFSAQPPQKTAEELATELEAIVEHLRTILTNPSFVPIEEVEVREEAINRLRAGLATMEERWKDAVQLIDGWRRRMVSSGKSVDVEDLKMGLRLSPVRVRNVEETSHVVPLRLPCVEEEDEEEEEDKEEAAIVQEPEQVEEAQIRRSPSPAESLHLVPAPGYEAEDNDEDSDSYSSIFQDDVEIDDLDVEEPNVQILQASTTLSRDSSSPLPEPPQLSPLKDSYSSGNKRSGNGAPVRKGPGDFSTIVEENTWDLIAVEEEPEEPVAAPAQSTKPKSLKHRPAKLKLDTQHSRPTSSDSAYDSPLFGKSGERPSQSPPSRKLFSKPSVPAPAPASAPPTATIPQQPRPIPRPQPEPEPTQPTRRITRAATRKSQEAPPSPSVNLSQAKTRSSHKRTSSDPSPKKESTHARMGTPTRHMASKSTSSSSKATSETAASTVIATTTIAPAPAPALKPAPAPASPTKTQQTPQRPMNRSPVRRETVPPTTASSRLPRRNNPPPPQQSPLTMATIAAKLAASEREADAARVRAKLRALRKGGRANTTSATANNEDKTADISVQPEHSQLQPLQEEDVDPVKKDLDPPPPLTGSTSLSRSQKQRQKETQSQGRPTSRGKNLNGNVNSNNVKANTVDDDDVDELALGSNPNISPSRSRRLATNNSKDNGGSTPSAAADLNEAMSKAKRRRDRRTSKVASVRRSTLSPWELESLIQGNVAVSPSAAGVESPAR